MFGKKKSGDSVPKGMGGSGTPMVEITAVYEEHAGGWDREFNGSIPARGANNIEVAYYVAQATGTDANKIRVKRWGKK